MQDRHGVCYGAQLKGSLLGALHDTAWRNNTTPGTRNDGDMGDAEHWTTWTILDRQLDDTDSTRRHWDTWDTLGTSLEQHVGRRYFRTTRRHSRSGLCRLYFKCRRMFYMQRLHKSVIVCEHVRSGLTSRGVTGSSLVIPRFELTLTKLAGTD